MVDEQVAYWQTLARTVGEERDRRYEELRASEIEADRYRVALARIAEGDFGVMDDPMASVSHVREIAAEALGLRQEGRTDG